MDDRAEEFADEMMRLGCWTTCDWDREVSADPKIRFGEFMDDLRREAATEIELLKRIEAFRKSDGGFPRPDPHIDRMEKSCRATIEEIGRRLVVKHDLQAHIRITSSPRG